MKVFERENISVTQLNLENISVTQPTLENISVIRPTLENIFLWLDQLSSFHHRNMNSPFHHQKMEKSISPFQIMSHWHNQRNFQRKMKKGTDQMTHTQTHHCKTRHQRKINAIRIKDVVNTVKMTRQTHHRATIRIRLTTVITDASNVIGKAIKKVSDQTMRMFNGKVADNSV